MWIYWIVFDFINNAYIIIMIIKIFIKSLFTSCNCSSTLASSLLKERWVRSWCVPVACTFLMYERKNEKKAWKLKQENSDSYSEFNILDWILEMCEETWCNEHCLHNIPWKLHLRLVNFFFEYRFHHILEVLSRRDTIAFHPISGISWVNITHHTRSAATFGR